MLLFFFNSEEKQKYTTQYNYDTSDYQQYTRDWIEVVCVKNKSSSNYNTAAYKTKCKEKGLLEKVYIARCPECGSLIKMDKDRLKLFSIEDCYVCEKNITWEDEDIVPVYVLLEKRRSN